MRIRMLVDLQGYAVRSDGSTFDWPPRGGEIDVEDQVGVDMCRALHAVPVPTAAPVEDTLQRAPEEEERIGSAARVFAQPAPAPEAPPQVAEAPAGEAPPQVTEQPVRRGPGRPRTRPLP